MRSADIELVFISRQLSVEIRKLRVTLKQRTPTDIVNFHKPNFIFN